MKKTKKDGPKAPSNDRDFPETEYYIQRPVKLPVNTTFSDYFSS